jgi:hypothetical protein
MVRCEILPQVHPKWHLCLRKEMRQRWRNIRPAYRSVIPGKDSDTDCRETTYHIGGSRTQLFGTDTDMSCVFLHFGRTLDVDN